MRELDWFDGPEDTEAAPRRRPRWFPALIAVPWLVVVGLLVAPPLSRDAPMPDAPGGEVADAATTAAASEVGASDDLDAPEAEGVIPPPTEAVTPTDPPAPTAPASAAADTTMAEVVEIREYRGGWRVAPGSEEAASLALVIARAWLTGVGPALAVPGLAAAERDVYAEHLVVEATERTSADTEVVTVLAVTLRDVDAGTPTVGVERLGVPIAWDEHGPRPAGAPWPLPGPDLTPRTPELVPIENDPQAWDDATAALAQAGLGTHRLDALRRAPDGPVVATIVDEDRRHEVWLRPHLGGYVVAGATLRGLPGSGAGAEDRP